MSDIQYLEWVPIGFAADLDFLELLRKFCDKKILFYIDNKALVNILNNKPSKSVRVTELVRCLVLHSMIHSIFFKACHIAPFSNAIANSSSRKQWTRVRALVPKSRSHPIQIPDDFIKALMISKLKLNAWRLILMQQTQKC